MKRRTLLLTFCLALAVAFAAWNWFRPYDWSADPAARYRIAHTSLRADHSFRWLEVYLKHRGGAPHDLQVPVKLRLLDGRTLDPAETKMEGDATHPMQALAFQFWMEERDFSGPLTLELNGGTLTVRTGSGLPATPDGTRFFLNSHW